LFGAYLDSGNATKEGAIKLAKTLLGGLWVINMKVKEIKEKWCASWI